MWLVLGAVLLVGVVAGVDAVSADATDGVDAVLAESD